MLFTNLTLSHVKFKIIKMEDKLIEAVMDEITKKSFFTNFKNFNLLANERHFIACGGAGINFLEKITQKKVNGKFSYFKRKNEVSIHINNAVVFEYDGFKDKENEYYNDFQIKLKHIFLTPEMENYLLSANNFVLLSGFGGKTGTYYTEILIDFFQKNNKTYQAFITLPCAFEGRKRNELARNIHDKLNDVDNITFYDLEYILKKTNKSVTIHYYFSKIDEYISSLFSR